MPLLLLALLIALALAVLVPPKQWRALRGGSAARWLLWSVALVLLLRVRLIGPALLVLAWPVLRGPLLGLLRAPSGARSRPDAAPPPAARDMTRQEALQILGLEEGASEEQVLAAYRRLMKRLHPDTGGSDYLAAKINQAKNVLVS